MKLDRYAVVDDVGTVMNPIGLKGQIHGGVAQGVAEALYEEAILPSEQALLAKLRPAAGIPVFCMDREIEANDAAVSQILSDNYSGCVALGQYFVEQVGESGTYVELLGIVADTNTWNRSKGFHWMRSS